MSSANPFIAAATGLLWRLLALAGEELRDQPGGRVSRLGRGRDDQLDGLPDLMHDEAEERAAASFQRDDRSQLVSRVEVIRQAHLTASQLGRKQARIGECLDATQASPADDAKKAARESGLFLVRGLHRPKSFPRYGAVTPTDAALPAPSHAVTWTTPFFGSLLQITLNPVCVVPSGQLHWAARSVPWPPTGERLSWAFV